MVKANETLKQLGGSNRLKAMINAKYFTHTDNGATLTFQFSGAKKASHLAITINDRDLYDITFFKVGRKAGSLYCADVAKFEDISVENLKSTIEEFTSLRLSL